jgi:hypothetical protein
VAVIRGMMRKRRRRNERGLCNTMAYCWKEKDISTSEI